MRSLLHSFNKYELYLQSVQSPDVDVVFYRKVFRDLRRQEPTTFREDFCGTFALCTEWVKLNSKNVAYGLDLDLQPLEYGRAHHFTSLAEAQQKRLHIHQQNVLKATVGNKIPRVDIIAAVNFSYFIFKTKKQLLNYFTQVLKGLKPGGVFIVDLFGGSECCGENEEKTSYKKFNYFWHQHGFDPVTAEAKFSIHFQIKGQKKMEDVFTYDWRMWTIPEVREIMLEAGFKKTHVYWEGTNSHGGGNGVFSHTEIGEECEAWIAYVVGEK
jgi:SAM-dependent methyltransferase